MEKVDGDQPNRNKKFQYLNESSQSQNRKYIEKRQEKNCSPGRKKDSKTLDRNWDLGISQWANKNDDHEVHDSAF